MHPLRPSMPLVLLALLCACLVGCGGGGGDDDGGGLPGTFTVVAVENGILPGPTPGAFAEFPSTGGAPPLMAMAAGGWSAFVAPTTNVVATEVAYVMDPAGTLVEVLARGQALPAPSDGTVGAFRGIWMAAAGIAVLYVDVVGDTGGRSHALLSVAVAGGAAAAPVVRLYDNDVLAAAGDAGMANLMGTEPIHVADDGRVYILLLSTTGARLLASTLPAGPPLIGHVRTGDAIPGGTTVTDIEAIGIEPGGGRFAFVVETAAMDRRLLTGQPGSATFADIAVEGDALPAQGGGGSIADVHVGGPLLVYTGGSVVWEARGSAAANDEALLVGSSVSVGVLARRGDPVANASPGTLGGLRLLWQEGQAVEPYFAADVVAGPNGLSFGLFRIVSTTSPPVLGLFNGRALPAPPGAALGTTFPSLDRPPLLASARNNALGFANVTSTGVSAVYWLHPAPFFVAVAVEGQTAVGTDVWGPFSPAAFTTVSTDGIQWLGRLATADVNGIFRRVL